jgi:hypothetical protein
MTQKRPQTSDFAPYFAKYISLVPDGDLLEILETQHRNTRLQLDSLTDAQGDFRYAPGKWSIKETLGHLTDAERVFSYRLLSIARGDQTPLPSFEQDDYVKVSNAASRKMSDLLDEFTGVRHATISLVRSLDNAAWLRRGNSSGKEISTLALAFVIVGHERHHQNIFEEQYLPALPGA